MGGCPRPEAFKNWVFRAIHTHSRPLKSSHTLRAGTQGRGRTEFQSQGQTQVQRAGTLCPRYLHSAVRVLTAPVPDKCTVSSSDIRLQTGASPRPCHKGPETPAPGCMTAKCIHRPTPQSCIGSPGPLPAPPLPPHLPAVTGKGGITSLVLILQMGKLRPREGKGINRLPIKDSPGSEPSSTIYSLVTSNELLRLSEPQFAHL